jgi:hypothetical protein
MPHASLLLPDADSHWLPVRDGHALGKALHRRHYSARASSTSKLFVGPGGKLVLLTPDAKALFVWRRFIDDCIDTRTGEKQQGVNCAAFRNEGTGLLSSDLLLHAEAFAWKRWPGERLYTYVNPAKIKSENPGCCFKKAGWKRCGTDKKGKLIFEKLPANTPTL